MIIILFFTVYHGNGKIATKLKYVLNYMARANKYILQILHDQEYTPNVGESTYIKYFNMDLVLHQKIEFLI